MAEETKSTPTKTESSAPSAAKSENSPAGQNGKGDAPRNCFSDKYRSNFDAIKWSK